MKISIKLSNGEQKVGELDQDSVIIGRSQSADFVVVDDTLSRKHALVESENGSFFITDLESQNGVTIDGQRINANTKTPLSTYQILQLGPLECHISESELIAEAVRSFPNAMPTPQSNTKSTVANIKNRTFPPRDEVASSSTSNRLILSIAFFAAVIGIFIYTFTRDSNSKLRSELPHHIRSKPSPSGPRPEKALDEFLSKNIYQQLSENKSCLELYKCQELNLSEGETEGMLAKENELFVYMKSSKQVSKRFSPMGSDPTVTDIASIYSILASKLYDQMISHQISQIHLILIDDNKKMYRVYRFNRSHLGTSRIDILNEIRNAISGKGSDAFWTLTRPLIPSLDL